MAEDIVSGKTTIDSMLEYINSNGKSDVNTIATVLGTYPGIVEDWAKILESGGLVKITNEIGKMFVAPVNAAPAQNVAATELMSIQKARISQSTEYQHLREEQLKSKIEELYKEANVLDKEFMRKFPALHKTLSELDNMFRKATDAEKRINEIQKKAESEKKSAITKFDYEYKKLEDISAKSVDIQKITELAEDAKRFESVIEDLKTNKKKELEAVRKDIDDQVRLLKKTLDEAEREIDAEIKRTSDRIRIELQNLNEWNAIAKSTSQNLPKTISEEKASLKRMSDLKAKVESDYNSIEKALGQLASDYKLKALPLFDSIEEMNQAISEKGGTGRAIIEANQLIIEAKKELDTVQKDISLLERGLKSINLAQPKTGKQNKMGMLGKLEIKSNELKGKLDKISGKVDSATNILSSAKLVETAKKEG